MMLERTIAKIPLYQPSAMCLSCLFIPKAGGSIDVLYLVIALPYQ